MISRFKNKITDLKISKLSLLFILVMVLLGLFTRPAIEGFVWLKIVHASLFIIPVICQLSNNKMIKIYGIWFGVFLILHGYASKEIKPKVLTIQPNFNRYVTIKSGLPGVEGEQHITTDHRGFRTTKPINYEHKDGNTYRIFALGASTTEQIWLDDKTTWTHLLQEGLSKEGNKNIEVINTGVSGIRAEQTLETMKVIKQYSPDMVIFLLGINDWNKQIYDEVGALPIPKKERFHNIQKLHKKLAFDKSLLGKLLLNIFAEKGDNKSTYIFDGKYDELRGSLYKKPQKSYHPDNISNNYTEYLNKILLECKDNEIKCVFLTQPNGYNTSASEEYKKSFWMTPAHTDYTLDIKSLAHIAKLYNNYLKEFTKKNNTGFCDLAKDIPASQKYMSDECHFNTHGAKTVASSLQKCISPMLKD